MTMNARLSVDNRGIDKAMAQNCWLAHCRVWATAVCLSVCLSMSVHVCVRFKCLSATLMLLSET